MNSLKRNPSVQPTNQLAECTLRMCIIQGIWIAAGTLPVERMKSLLQGDRQRCPSAGLSSAQSPVRYTLRGIPLYLTHKLQRG